jgi:hypothetical protein
LLDLRELIKGNSYTLQTQLNIKGFTFHTRALDNTKANGFLFINSELITLFTHYCGARSKPLPYAISVTGYDDNGNSRITHYVRLTLQINNRRFVRIPFCIALLGKHNIIIGRKWFKYFKINLAITDRKLLWPQSLPPTYFFNKLIKVTRESMALQRIDLLDQANAKRHDRALNQEDKQKAAPSITILQTADVYTANVFTTNVPTANVFTANAAGPKERKLWTPTVGQHNYANKQRRSLRNMQAMLASVFQPTPKYCQRSSVTSPLPTKASEINLFKISAVTYKLLSRKKNHETFTASLNKLDFLLADRQAIDQITLTTLSKIDYSPDKHLINKYLAKFPQYASFKDVCDKRASDQLPLRCTAVNHKIELT